MYIETDITYLNAYGHKIRELLILACAECERLWVDYIRPDGDTNQRLTISDYVKPKDKLFYQNTM